MIKVYIFITGLVLYQFASTAGGTNYAILASGNYDYPGLAHLAGHEITVSSGDSVVPVPLALPLEAKLSVSCPSTTGCSAILEPQEIPSLVDLLAEDKVVPKAQSGCTAFDGGASCHPRGLSAPGRNGLLTFTGDWKAAAFTDCEGSTYPQQLGPLVDTDFVRAGRAWELRFTDPDKLISIANSVLFTTVVAKMDDLQVSNPQLKALLDPARMSSCAGLPDPTPGATRCAVVLIRNGSTETYHGGGDLHYAALYALLENQLPAANLWLPISSMKGVCHGGGGSVGLTHCTGGRLPKG